MSRVKRPTILAALAIGTVLVASACSGQGASATPAATAGGSTPAATPGQSIVASPSATITPATATVRLALDWTPNTNHIGFYVAQQDGAYAAQAIDLQVLPYASTSPEILVSSGAAECGISTQEGATFAIAAGAKERSVMAILAHTATEIAVRDDGSITRPKDLDGKLYAGFGLPQEVPELQAVIKADGGTGKFKVATLDTAAYEALYNGKADFTITFTAWEGIEARERGGQAQDVRLHRLRHARLVRGRPRLQRRLAGCQRRRRAAVPGRHRCRLRDGRGRSRRCGGQADRGQPRRVRRQPGPAARVGPLPGRAEAVRDAGRHRTPDGRGWNAFSGFLFDTGLLAGPDGKPLASRPDFGAYFTNDYLP